MVSNAMDGLNDGSLFNTDILIMLANMDNISGNIEIHMEVVYQKH